MKERRLLLSRLTAANFRKKSPEKDPSGVWTDFRSIYRRYTFTSPFSCNSVAENAAFFF
jgi:hypothetical protein